LVRIGVLWDACGGFVDIEGQGMSQAHSKRHLSSAAGGGDLKVDDQLRQHVHFLDQLANIAGSGVLDRQIVTDLVGRGDSAIISDKPD
jgi:hypothetical protein